jgi:hypothetical protein
MQDHGKSRPKNTSIPLDALNKRYGNAVNLLRIYLDICKCLSGRCAESMWSEYSDPDWRLFEKVALGEGVAATINSKKPELKPLLEHIPLDIWLNFSAMRMRVRHTNGLRFKELSENVFPAVLPDMGPVVLLKGSAMAPMLYEDISLRGMCDTDLLVTSWNLNAITAKLKEIGYNIFTESITPLRPVTSSVFEDKDISLKKSGANGLVIELHWKLIRQHHQKAFDLDSWFFKELMPVPDNGAFQSISGLFMLSHTACLLHQIFHVYFWHSISSSALFHLYETYLLAEKWYELIEWDRLSEIFEMLGLTEVLSLASDMSEELFGKALPLEKTAAAAESPLYLRLKAQPMRTAAADSLYVLRHLSLRQQIKFIFESVFPSPSFMKMRYNNQKSKSLALLYMRRLSDGLSDLPRLIKSLMICRHDCKKCVK